MRMRGALFADVYVVLCISNRDCFGRYTVGRYTGIFVRISRALLAYIYGSRALLACIYGSLHAHGNFCVWVYAYIYLYICLCIYTYICIYINVCIYIHVCIYIYIYI